MSRIKKVVRDLVIISLVTITMLFVLELSLRLKGYPGYHFRSILFGNDPNSSLLFRNSATLWWRLNSNVRVNFLNTIVHTDTKGFRTSQKLNIDSQRPWPIIICIGDSSTFGWRTAYESTYPFILEKLLQKEFQNPRVHNLGVPGYTSFQAKQYLEEKVDEINPDIVIIYLSNNECSITPISDRDRRKQEQKYLWIKRVLDDLYLYQLALEYSWKDVGPFFPIKDMRLEQYLQMPKRVSLNEFESNLTEIITLLIGKQITPIILTVPYDIKSEFKISIPAPAQESNNVLDQAEAFIGTDNLDKAEHLITIAEKLTPDHYRISYLRGKVSDKKNTSAINHFEDAIEKYPFTNRLKKSYIEVIRKLAIENSIRCVDLYAVFRSFQQQNRKDLFIDAVHPSTQGYAIIANVIYDELKKVLPESNNKAQ
jgi:lysophospholipase L1-like esterase